MRAAEPLDLVIAGGVAVTPEGCRVVDIGVADGRIAAIGPGLEGAERVDARGLTVLPGGVDSHCHLEQWYPGGPEPGDDWASGTASALAGGTTTLIAFANQVGDLSLGDAVADARRRAERARCDYSLHLTVTNPTPETLSRDLPTAVAAGCASVKLFMTYEGWRVDDAALLATLAAAKAAGAIVCIHAENDALIAHATRELLARGHTRPADHARSRPLGGEREATARAIALAEAIGQEVQIFHVSHAEVAEEVRRARARGVAAHAETCTQYLTLDATDLDRPGFEGAKFLASPPLREPAAREGLWASIRAGVIDVVTSDHSPSRWDDPKGKKINGEDAPFSRIPNGIPGLAARLPVLWSEGVASGRIDRMRFARLTATRAAELFRLPRKGRLALGMDADLALLDPAARWTLDNASQHHGLDFSPYEGRRLTGRIVATYLRGRLVFDGARVLAEPGFGRFLPRPASARSGSGLDSGAASASA